MRTRGVDLHLLRGVQFCELVVLTPDTARTVREAADGQLRPPGTSLFGRLPPSHGYNTPGKRFFVCLYPNLNP